MNILLDPREMAEKLINNCHVKDATSFWIMFGAWCKEYPNMPLVYVKAVASHIMAAGDSCDN